MNSSLTLIPTLSIHPDKIITYNEIHWEPFKPSKYNPIEKELQPINKYEHLLNSKRTANGKVSPIAKRKITKAINYLLLLSNPKKATSQLTGKLFTFKIAFITLTLPSKQQHIDNEIKSKCLNSLLLELKQFYHVKNYVWRAEKQCNGNIHFHIVIDKFVNWNELRNRWNRIINKLGYVDNYRKELKAFHAGGFKIREELIKNWSERAQKKAYKTGMANDWSSPNSTDIHSIKKVRNIKKYLIKYMSKQDAQNENENKINENEVIQNGRIWGCNHELSKITGARLIVDNEIQAEIERIIKESKCECYHAEYFSVFEININTLIRFKSDKLLREFSKYLFNTFGFSLQLEIAA